MTMPQKRSPEIVRRNFTYPKEFDEKFDRLMIEYNTASKSELLRLAIKRLEDDLKLRERARAQERETVDAHDDI